MKAKSGVLHDFDGQLASEWPVRSPARSLELGCVVENDPRALIDLAAREFIGRHSAGWWECDLPGDALTWTAGIYQIFGIGGAVRVSRQDAVALYTEDSRAKMERLRSYAIQSGRGFALDAQIRPADGQSVRWMRLIGSPVFAHGCVQHLQGLKFRI